MNDYLSSGEAAGLLGVSPDTLRLWDQQGILVPTRTAGGHRRYDRQQVLDHVNGGFFMSNDYLRQVFNPPVDVHLRDWDQYYSDANKSHRVLVSFVNYEILQLDNGRRRWEFGNKTFFLFCNNYFVHCTFPEVSLDDDKETSESIERRKHQKTSTVNYRQIRCLSLDKQPVNYPVDCRLTIELQDGSEHELQSKQHHHQSDQLLKVYEFLVGKLGA